MAYAWLSAEQSAAALQKLYVLEAFWGYYYFNVPDDSWFYVRENSSGLPTLVLGQSYTSHILADNIDKVYNDWVNVVHSGLVLQTRLAHVYDMLSVEYYEMREDYATFGLDFSAIKDYFTQAVADDPVNGLADLIDFTRAFEFYGFSQMGIEALYNNTPHEFKLNGYEMAYDFIQSLPFTTEMISLYEDLGINIVGSDGYNLQGTDGDDFTIGSDDNDYLRGANGNDYIFGGAGNDTIQGGAGNDVLYGNEGDDLLDGGNGNDVLYGGDGDDKLYGNAGDDILDGGAGNDTIETGTGNNIIVFATGYGHDWVNAGSATVGKYNVIRLQGLNPADVEFGTVQNGPYENYQDLIVRIKATGETLTIYRGNYEGSWFIQAVEFADGTVWTYDELRQIGGLHGTDGNDILYLNNASVLYAGAGNDTITGSSGDDVIYGGDDDDTITGRTGNDVFDGGAGNDTIETGTGNNTVVFGRGYGNDTVTALNAAADRYNVVRLVGLTSEDVEFNLVPNGYEWNLVIRIKDTDETLTIRRGFSTASFQIQAVEFADNTVWTYAEVLQQGIYGTANNDSISLSQAATIYAGAGNDTITGSNGDDAIYGGDGNDTLKGNAGNDYFDGGAGDDTITAGAGNNIVVFGEGYGNDTVTISNSGNDVNTIRLLGLNATEVEFGTAMFGGNWANQHLLIRIKATGETLTVYNGNAGWERQIQQVEFADGTVWSYADILASGLHGTAAGESLYLINGGKLYGEAGNDTVNGSVYDDYLYGGEGNDTLKGNAGNDVLTGGLGNDTLIGGAGDDTYIFGRGDGQDTINDNSGGDDLLNFTDINPAELWFGKSGNHLIINLVGSEDKVTVSNWYYNDSYKIDTIQAGDYAITESQVALMVQAMAAIGAPGGADGQWTQEQEEALQPVLSTYWNRAA